VAERDTSCEIELLVSKLAAVEELLAVQERTVAEQSATLVNAREKAVEATRAKSDFLARMSHELRTPLNSVIGFSNILLKNKPGNLERQDMVYLERIRENGTHLLHLVNSILDLSKIEARRMNVNNAPVAISELVHDTVAQLQGQVGGRAVRLTAECPRDIAPIITDGPKLKQVIINLVGNALKFTTRGSVIVRVHVDATSRCPTHIEVVDTGIGIPQDKLDHVFDAFEQLDGSSARAEAGTGLGLAISKSFCDLMGHSIEVESEEGRGATFRVVLREPALAGESRESKDSRSEKARSTVPTPAATGHGLTVLVIDDEADSRMLLTHQLEELGAEVITVGSGEEGLRVARDRRPDLITLDVMMPGMDGWQVLRRLKAQTRLRDIPVVVVSVSATDKKGSLLGAVDHLSKPVSREDLLAVLGRTSSRTARRALVVDDSAEARALLSGLLEEAGLRVVSAPNGHAALDALQSFAPDVITVDLMMPEMDGLSFIQAIRRDQRFLRVPVIVVSAREPSPEELQRLSGETRAILQKGEKIEESLRRVVRAVLDQRRT
jgi:signal transduction histidine kinase/CheY-like chemotaxis protein